MLNKIKLLLSAGMVFLPGMVLAALPSDLTQTFTDTATLVTSTLPKIFFGLAIVYFFWGLGKYAFATDDKSKDAAKTQLIYGVIILFVISSIWGIVAVIQSATGVGSKTDVTVPTIK